MKRERYRASLPLRMTVRDFCTLERLAESRNVSMAQIAREAISRYCEKAAA